ncbi:hypothetical protein MNB_SV-12-108 [hydrothermal vent metagenome]|uniref:Lipoprotein n=1 Tax=hydrothermal vent metagenome TaxID=652676 RepID=A0A1W1CFX1_9ZZZZ
MYKKIVLLFTLLLITGCNIKDNSNIEQLFRKDDIYHISLLNTQKAQLIASLETKALLTATYLNPVYAHANCKNFRISIKNGEYFFIGVYINNSKTHHFNSKGYSLTLDGVKPIEIKELDKDDPLRYEMPMVDNWSTYYKVKFPPSNLKKFHLIFESDRFGKDILEFEQAHRKNCRSNSVSLY